MKDLCLRGRKSKTDLPLASLALQTSWCFYRKTNCIDIPYDTNILLENDKQRKRPEVSGVFFPGEK